MSKKNKVPGLRDNGSIDLLQIERLNQFYALLDFLSESFKGTKYRLSWEGNSPKINFTDGTPEGTRVFKIGSFNGSRPADCLAVNGIIAAYNRIRNEDVVVTYPKVGQMVEIGGIEGLGYKPGTFARIEGYVLLKGDPTRYASIANPRGGTIHIPADDLMGAATR